MIGRHPKAMSLLTLTSMMFPARMPSSTGRVVRCDGDRPLNSRNPRADAGQYDDQMDEVVLPWDTGLFCFQQK